jgi:hypothetical protein
VEKHGNALVPEEESIYKQMYHYVITQKHTIQRRQIYTETESQIKQSLSCIF